MHAGLLRWAGYEAAAMKTLALLFVIAVDILLYLLVVGMTWRQVGLLIVIGLGSKVVGDAIAKRRCATCGCTKWTYKE